VAEHRRRECNIQGDGYIHHGQLSGDLQPLSCHDSPPGGVSGVGALGIRVQCESIALQASVVARSNNVDCAGDQTGRCTSGFGGMGWTRIAVGVWRRTPCGVRINDGVLRLSVACRRALRSSSARTAIGPAANATIKAANKGFMMFRNWHRLRRVDSRPQAEGPQLGSLAALSRVTVLAACRP
jgi:hypothetical protein